MLFAFIPVALGMAARVAHPGITSTRLVLPTMLVEHLRPWLGALALAAVFSAEVDTCDAILFMLATSLSQDLYKRFVNPRRQRSAAAAVARAASLVGGALGVVLAIVLPPSVDRRAERSSIRCSASLFVPVVGGPVRAARRQPRGARGDRRRPHPSRIGAAGAQRRPWPRCARSDACSALARGRRPRFVHRRCCFDPGALVFNMADMFRLDGKVVAVIGAGSGIGEAVALGAAPRRGARRLPRRQRRAAQPSAAADPRRADGSAGTAAVDIADEAGVPVARSTPIVDAARQSRRPRLHAGHQRAQADSQLHRRRVRSRRPRQPARQLQRAAGGRADHDGAEVGQHRVVLVDSFARDRAGAVGLLDEQGRHRAAGEDARRRSGRSTASGSMLSALASSKRR